MARPSCAASLLFFLLASPAVLAISLDDFVPRLDPSSLTPACAAVYNAPIAGCTAADFAGPAGNCSSACIGGMLNLGANIYSACAASAQNRQGVVEAFLDGSGPPSLCPDMIHGEGQSSASATSSSSVTAEATSMPASTTTSDVTSLTSETSMLSSLTTPAATGLVTATDSPTASTSSSSSAMITPTQTSMIQSVTSMSPLSDNPPAALTASSTSSGADPTSTDGCVSGGGGGSIVGGESCSEHSNAAAFVSPGLLSVFIAGLTSACVGIWALA